MTEMSLPTGDELDAAIVAATEGRLPAEGFAAALELVVGVQPAQDGAKVAHRFADRVADADPAFRGLSFVDLDGWLLEAAREHSLPLA